jgi:UDP-N-acetylmuramate dehydrogenase
MHCGKNARFHGGIMPDNLMNLLTPGIPAAQISRHEWLKNHTTLKVGGPADYFITAHTEEQAIFAMDTAKNARIPLLVLGNGSNILALDGGMRGAILYIGKSMARIHVTGNTVTAQAGASLATAARFAATHGLAGLEFASGIPGTVGGGVTMNAGAYGAEIGGTIVSVRVYTDAGIQTLTRSEMCFGYRTSIIQKNNWVVLSATFELKPDYADAISVRMNSLSVTRREKQPLQYPSAGSFFKRPANHFAGALIEQAGLKGYKVGCAQVSELHAGFLVSTGDALAWDFIRLMRHVQDTVFTISGIWLMPEVHIIGQVKE